MSLEWWLILALIFGSFLVLLLIGLPIAFAFTLINVVGVFLFWHGGTGLRQLSLSIFDSVATWTMVPIPMFVLMGEVMFHSRLAFDMVDALDKWVTRVPGRLGLVAVLGGTLFATCSGSSVSGTALLGTILVPEMERRGYQKTMSLGPIMSSGGLATMIPPSFFTVFLACLAGISVGKTLMGGIVPGMSMAFLYASYIVIRCWLQLSLAPPYTPVPKPVSEKLMSLVRHVLPLSFIVFLVIGATFLGIASPTEASAAGALGCFILAAVHRSLNWQMFKESIFGTLRISVMVLMILTGSTAFSQILSFSGAAAGLIKFAAGLPLPPIMLIIAMQVFVLFLGCFMDGFSIAMIVTPIFMPIVRNLGFDPIWFVLILLLNCETGMLTPPFGMVLFTMKGVAPPDTTMADIYKAALPFVICNLIVMVLMIAFPAFPLWLPGLMFKT